MSNLYFTLHLSRVQLLQDVFTRGCTGRVAPSGGTRWGPAGCTPVRPGWSQRPRRSVTPPAHSPDTHERASAAEPAKASLNILFSSLFSVYKSKPYSERGLIPNCRKTWEMLTFKNVLKITAVHNQCSKLLRGNLEPPDNHVFTHWKDVLGLGLRKIYSRA